MPFMPFHILGTWFRGLVSIAIIVGGIYLLSRWYDESHVVMASGPGPIVQNQRSEGDRSEENSPAIRPARTVLRYEPGMNRQTAYLASGIALLSLAGAGRWLRRLGSMMLSGAQTGQGAVTDEPSSDRSGEVHKIRRPDGSSLRIETYGPADAPPLVMTHGWGADSTEWFYAKKSLAGRFRLILWDEPGLGLSTKPDNNDYRMENLAADLGAVLTFAGDLPAILVGHSIGGMIVLTFCKVFPESLSRRVAGLVLVHTTYTNPVRTTKMAGLYSAIETPVIIPLLYLTIAVWPLVWVMNWLSYLNGSAHRSTHKASFAGTETRGQLDFFARFMPRARPDVLARGMLGMIAYDATATLKTIPAPILVVTGDQDSTTLPEAGDHIARCAPNAELATLAPAKHLGLIEHHSTFGKLVADFAEACLATGIVRS
jgi:pimeloyl-ACP methyl ester carboxylesterase